MVKDTPIDFTIVTASYNYGQYIGECLKSVAEQAGVTLEHLVMDAGSKDETAEVVKGYPHATFFQEPDQGMSDGINKGFLKAKGRWVMWLNADDRLKPGALREVKAFADAHPAADVIFGCWDYIDKDGGFLRRMSLFPFRKGMLIQYGCYIGSTACFYRNETTIQEGYLLNENFHYCMDGEYYARLATSGKSFAYLPCVLADFRLHGESISQQHLKKSDINGVLHYKKQRAEPATIRRIYGVCQFRSDLINNVLDFPVMYFHRLLKPILKILHKSKTHLPSIRQDIP